MSPSVNSHYQEDGKITHNVTAKRVCAVLFSLFLLVMIIRPSCKKNYFRITRIGAVAF